MKSAEKIRFKGIVEKIWSDPPFKDLSDMSDLQQYPLNLSLTKDIGIIL